MEATVKWVDGMMFVGSSGSGHSVVMDGSLAVGGKDLGIRPMEMLLLGMGGCSYIDVIDILKKGRADVVDCTVELTAQRADETPKVMTKLHVHYIVKGGGLKPTAVERAIELSVGKYCSASVMIGKTADITHDFEIIEV